MGPHGACATKSPSPTPSATSPPSSYATGGHAEIETGPKPQRLRPRTQPFNSFTANVAWMELVLTAADLLAWCQSICLDGHLARAEPRTLATDCFTPPIGSSAKLDA